MTQRLDFIVPGDPAQRTGGYLYDAHIVAELRRLGWTVDVHGLPGRFPEADATARDALEQTLSALPSGRQVVVDGLALGGLPEVAIRHGYRLRLVALVHHPLADERGLSVARRHCLLASERAALAAARLVITTSNYTARRIADFGLQPSRVGTVEPGVTPLPLALADGDSPRLLCVGTLSPRKGQDLLVRALHRLHELPWHCDCIGSSARDPHFAHALAGLIAKAGLDERIQLHGECDDAQLRAAYAGADLFVLPSHYEGYGMVVSEAISAGLPVLTTTGGALAETLPAGAGIAVPPDNVDALAEALGTLIGNRSRRHALRDGARKARAVLRDWPRAGAEFAAALSRMERSPASTPIGP
ncbi:glycosyltransferase family 4 protein [Thauera sp.]|jgi:glycosyltransferase involved in cell wall biosynthesis|uniref:glycosyltransferase family 4 protein n=1 Tax=Thauera sp. TaxID=1905334 RepID=UPI002A36F6E3|nr:glycosyltransferase family 4 protein [Thauera sp.]MDX9886456.1 glycosyltransferase family 4 protein [Thauera sp.]